MAILLLKGIVGRARPDIIAKLEYGWWLFIPKRPHIHRAGDLSRARVSLSDLVRNAGQSLLFVVAGFIALVVGFSRVYLGVHYPTDVLAGWGFGLAWAIVCGAVAVRLIR